LEIIQKRILENNKNETNNAITKQNFEKKIHKNKIFVKRVKAKK
jgi:hypothetical protein